MFIRLSLGMLLYFSALLVPGCADSDQPSRSAGGGALFSSPSTPNPQGGHQEPTSLQTGDAPLVCDDGNACPGGECLLGSDGVTTCAMPCDDGCPEGRLCKLVGGSGTYPRPLCIVLEATQCDPCTNHDDCNQSVDGQLNRCVSHDGDGAFCATNCGESGTTCPVGSSCQEIPGGEGVLTSVCLPDSGECTCSPSAISSTLSTPCSVTNSAGTCEGSRVCLIEGLSQCLASTPVTETCNGLDDDCDSAIDEGVLSPCGTCSGSCVFETSKESHQHLGPTQNPFGDAVADVLSNTHPVIWIANSEDSTATRMNTETGCEEARYYVCGNPSRTAVDKDGNGFITCRADGIVAKIAIETKDCVDTNGNGVIETSKDLNGDCQITANEMVTNDECIMWTAKAPGSSCARAAGVDADGHLWVGAYNIKQVVKLSGQTGGTMVAHPISGAPYGLAIGTDQTIWIASRDNASLLRVDPELGQTGQWSNPIGNCYGLAIDPYGKIWVAGGEGSGGGGVARFDPDTSQWTSFTGLAPGYTRGVAIKLVYGPDLTLDTAKVYVAHHTFGGCPADGQHRKIGVIDALTLQVEPSIDIGADRGPVGVAIDTSGFLWTVNQCESTASKVNTETGEVVGTYPVGSGPYTYSDMTGYALNTITSLTAIYRQVFEGWSTGETVWDHVSVLANLPAGTHAEVQYRVGLTPDHLKQAEWSEPMGPFPPMTFPLTINATGRYLEVRALLTATDPDQLPSYDKMIVAAHQL